MNYDLPNYPNFYIRQGSAFSPKMLKNNNIMLPKCYSIKLTSIKYILSQSITKTIIQKQLLDFTSNFLFSQNFNFFGEKITNF